MRLLSKCSLAVLALGASFAASAFTYGTTQTYGGLTWSVSTEAGNLAPCTQLLLNANGDLANTSALAVYGTYNCPALNGGYAASGVAYFGTDGTFNMTVNFGTGWQLGCVRISSATLTGQCAIYDSTGTYRGGAYLTFL